ncbi:hypothetical protein [Chryseobacterium potabilaquae]|uniref:Uncharacterized protein n=1 Tax=Chryseobacterium potabilaquae TaxID=2675057 RepID=A0A6N4XAH4_9FLAO|nr:hypothetical protein [Chryseobacterium potabilaquae]CAA7196057.1 hypothetical protein CHRY9293_02191 [Chryseobacterium potabilaquae]
MTPLFLIPVVLVVAGIIFMVYMNKKHQSVKSEIDWDSERKKYTLYNQDVLMQDFPQLKEWMNGKPIDAYTSASVPQSTTNKVQHIISDGMKNVALSTIGVKLRRIETECFWVLSGSDLHFFSTNTVGELDEHIVFDHFRIEEAKLQYGGILKSQLGIYSKSSEEYLPKIHIITFDIDETPVSLEIHDRLNYVPDPTDLLDMKKQLTTRVKYQVVGEKFVKILQDKFPNLQII